MKILRIRATGLPLYKEPFDVSFYAAQRVQENHLNSVYRLFGNIYVNTTEAFIGVNASGKTNALKVMLFAYALLSANPLNNEHFSNNLENNRRTIFDIDFFSCNKVYHLTSEIVRQKKADDSYTTKIVSESLWAKSVTSKINKTNLLDFEGLAPVRIRNNSDEYLPDDVSIMIAVNKILKDDTVCTDRTAFTNINIFRLNNGVVSAEIISLLDPTIEYISSEWIKGKTVVKLKFHGQEELILYNPFEINTYLSSGTVKGVMVFTDAVLTLQNGGYLFIDEIENHFNQELVAALLRLFLDKRTNPKGAVIVFSTHYPELLDELERNDSVFITRNEKDKGLTVNNLSSLLDRNDLKKSEVYQSNFLGGTAPKYNALAALRKSIIRSLEA